MPRIPRTPPRKPKVRGDSTPKKGLPEADPNPGRIATWRHQFRTFALCCAALLISLGYLLFRFCQTPPDWPTFPLAEVGPWPLEQKLYSSLSTDRASNLEVPLIDINRHLARHLLAHPAIGARSPSLEAIQISGNATQPKIAARFRWNILPLHLRATAARSPKEQRTHQDTGFSITQISIGSLRMPDAARDSLLKWFNPLMATLKREKYLLKRSSEIVSKPDSVVFHVDANPVGVPETSPPSKLLPPKRSPPSAAATNPSVPKALPAVPKSPPKAERVP
jgi:hypothetical protein